ncbi:MULTISPECIES: hypothetical protein [Enterobacter cloacae complex]|uniref:Uncharacterized protein n=1 Tax=Enterobacter cloacae TaxID=550 RepID=A0AB37VBU0_ENTCL|nr:MULTISPECIES: hypothetical protein [Enterobacter cloacae complex]MBY6353779.1 hypothetical protein [Enterobacter sichuanensis]RWT72185.1 hypothetical protein DN595_25075 [Enterobacter cloacae]
MSIQPKYGILSPEQQAIADELLKDMSTYQPNRQELHGLTLPMPLQHYHLPALAGFLSTIFLMRVYFFYQKGLFYFLVW